MSAGTGVKNRILIPLDGSERSETVLPFALTVAVRCGYEPVLLSVWETHHQSLAEAGTDAVARMNERGRDYLRTYLHTVIPACERLDLPVEAEVRSGHPAVEIIAATQDLDAAMVAMSTHGQRAVPGEARGGIADKVLRGCALPILAVGPEVAPPTADAPVPLRRILVPLDGSSEAEQALPVALDLAKGLHSEVHLVRVATPVTGSYGPGISEGLIGEMNEERRHEAKAYLESVRAAHKDRVISAQTLLGFPVAALRGLIDESDIDLVVMTSHSRYATGLWTLGRVADSLLDGPVPVVLVRPS